MKCVNCPHLCFASRDEPDATPVTELGRNELRMGQVWFAEQNQFMCAKAMETFEDLTPNDLLRVVTRDRDCEGSRPLGPAVGSGEEAAQGPMRLPAWQVAIMIITAVAAVIAAGIAIWQAF